MDHIDGFWGKAGPAWRGITKGNVPSPAPAWHPWAYHSLDVAACAVALLESRPSWQGALCASGPHFWPVLSTVFRLAAIHDIAKIGAFQNAVDALQDMIGGTPIKWNQLSNEWRHDAVGFSLLQDTDLMDVLLAQEVDYDTKELLARASACHHGRPCDFNPSWELSVPWKQFAAHSREGIAKAFVQDVIRIDSYSKIPFVPCDAQRGQFSIALAALINLADWLGSDSDFFPFEAPIYTLADYWILALDRAKMAVAEKGLREHRTPSKARFRQLFPKLTSPTPMQATLDTIRLPDGQFLMIVEDMTGAGKTEAGLTVAARRMASGHASGLFFGMPTTATANQQARRQAEVIAAMYAPDETPSLVIAHASPGAGAVAASSEDRERMVWIADERRRRLLADICVGTVDQALLAAMPSKFAMIRVAGLMGKLLILDEVHCYDTYTETLVDGLLRLHVALGGSVIALSATLSSERKRRLARAFYTGLGEPEPLHTKERTYLKIEFPLVSVLSSGRISAASPGLALPPASKKLRFARSEAEAYQYIMKNVRAGRCIAWIRNTVSQAVESAKHLDDLGLPDVICAHSRFTELDRADIDRRLTEAFGPASTATQRQGRVVVATSVIETGLDLDFDVMIVDLKPVDDLIQTLGRERRHARDKHGNRLANPFAVDQRISVETMILSPDPNDVRSKNWYRGVLGDAALIHRDLGVLWRTAHAFENHGAIHPSNLRSLIEAVYGDDVEPMPDELGDGLDAEGEEFAQRQRAKQMVDACRPDRGYGYSTIWWSEDRIPTRLGDAIELLLVEDGATFMPYGGGAWSSGRIRASTRKAFALPGVPDDDPRLVGLPKFVKVLPGVQTPDAWVGQGFIYTAKYGLEIR